MRATRLFAWGLVLVLASGFLFAQSDRGTVKGTVSDSSGAVIPGVQVKATNVATGITTTAESNDLGLYSVLNLPIGTYTLSFTKDGFQTFVRRGVAISVAQVVEINAKLAVGAATETVTVIEDAPLLETESSQLGTRMKGNVLNDLPLVVGSDGRQLDAYAIKAVPGVEGNLWETHIAGSQAFSKEVTIDGTSAVAQIGGHITENSPSMEAIQEYQVEVAGQRASDGKSGGGVYQYTLKSGSNDFHGSAFGFLRNEILNANTWYNNYTGTEKPRDRQFDYGFSAGGPIFRNKTFVFGAWERYQQKRFVLSAPNATVPVPAFLTGDFSRLLDTSTQYGVDAAGNPIYRGAIFDPANPGQVFVGNIIPADRLSATALKVGQIYSDLYAPVNSSLTNNNARVREINPYFVQDQISIKLDHNFSEANRLGGSWIYTRRPRTLVDQGGVWAAGSEDGGPLAASRLHFVRSHGIRLSDTHTFSSNLINVASVTYNRFKNPNTARSAEGNDWPTFLGFQNYGADNFPRINFGDGTNGVWTDGIGMALNNFYVSNIFIMQDDVTWVRGRHVFKFGGETRFMQMNSHGDADVLTFNFSKNQTGAPTTNYRDYVGFGFASFMLGAVDNASVSTGKQFYGRRNAASFYIQDDIKVNDRFTVNLDLRWDLNGRYHEKYGNWTNFNTQATNPALGIPGMLEFATGGGDSFERNQYFGNFAPRAGAAYKLTDKVVLRGSLSLFYSPLNLNYWSGVPFGFAPGYGFEDQVRSTPNFAPSFYWDGGYPGTPVNAAKDPNYTQWGMVSVDPDSLKTGRVLQWTFGGQYEISSDMRFDVTYMGNRGDRLQSNWIKANQPDPAEFQALAERGTMWNWVSDPASAAAAGVPYPYQGYSFHAWGALLPFPQVASTWGPIFYVGAPYGKSDYESLQLQLSKRAAKGVSANVSYNLARARGNTWSAWQETWWTGNIQNVYDLEKEAKTIQPHDRTHIFKGYAAWELPFGKGRALLSNAGSALNALVSGWTISSAFRYQSGNPVWMDGAHWYPGFNSVYLNWDPDGNYGSQFDAGNFDAAAAFSGTPSASNQYFDPNNFSLPTFGQLGNAPRLLSQLRNPGGAYEDFGVMKYLYFGAENRMSLQVRLEMTNIFNRHYYGIVSANKNSNMFGQVTVASDAPREGQFGVRFRW